MSEHRETITVAEVMKRNVDMVDGLTTVADALSRMKHVETKTLVVDKRHPGDEYGVVLISDIALAFETFPPAGHARARRWRAWFIWYAYFIGQALIGAAYLPGLL